jgi:hypothetical protein
MESADIRFVKNNFSSKCYLRAIDEVFGKKTEGK